MNLLQPIGRAFWGFLESTGRLAVFATVSVSHCVRPPVYPRLIGRQLIDIGYYSLPVVGLTTLFSGMVLALQSYAGLDRAVAELYERARERNPSGRATTPEDVAKAIAALSDPRLSWMTGNVIGVDGGEDLTA